MEVVDARRLTGPTLEQRDPGAVLELAFDAHEDAAALTEAVVGAIRAALAGVGEAPAIHVRPWDPDSPRRGATLAVAGPLDRLYPLVDLVEWAAKGVAGASTVGADEALATYRAAVVAQADPQLLALQAAAAARGVAFLWDDDEVSLGLGSYGRTWARAATPAVAEVPWDTLGAIPVVLVTGTNGKTTTTRMVARILKHAGQLVGASSTDALTVDEQILDKGDWTGPGAARKILRHPQVTAAVLETARGGLLRRGVALSGYDGAVVTNVGEDHFGDHGVASLGTMARTKAVVWSGVRPGGRRVANAEDETLVSLVQSGAAGDGPWVWFGLASDHPVLVAHAAQGGEVWTVARRESGDVLVRRIGSEEFMVAAVSDLPSALHGAAQHNVANALAAGALAAGLGISEVVIGAALASFGRHPRDNPGRLEFHEVHGVRVLLDFGHNPHGVRAVQGPIRRLLAAVPGARLSVCVGQAGDRSDGDLTGLVTEICACGASRAWVRPLSGYERGRASSETVRVLHQAFIDRGLAPDAVSDVADEVDALAHAFAWARPGDLLVHFVHLEREACSAWLAERAEADPG